MAVIWGLDLKEMQWGKFKNSYMWNNEYHLRRTKFIVYQLAMICESFPIKTRQSQDMAGFLSTRSLLRHLWPISLTSAFSLRCERIFGHRSLIWYVVFPSSPIHMLIHADYVDQQKYMETHHMGATVHNDDYIGIASYNIFVGIYVATIFGSAFFFDLFWPERVESAAVKLAWRICSVLACLMTLACALAYTVILATHQAYVTGANAAEAQRLLAEYGGSPLEYRKNGRALASLVFEWVGWPATVARYVLIWHWEVGALTTGSTVILWKSLAHNDKLGPKSTHARVRDSVAEKPEEAA
jgi:hypothetical protein